MNKSKACQADDMFGRQSSILSRACFRVSSMRRSPLLNFEFVSPFRFALQCNCFSRKPRRGSGGGSRPEKFSHIQVNRPRKDFYDGLRQVQYGKP